LKVLQKNELARLNDLELKFEEISDQYVKCKEELAVLRRNEITLKGELQKATVGRETFKEQYMEMREINKDLKLHFSKLERQVAEYQIRHDHNRNEGLEDTDYHRRGKSNKSKRRDQSDERFKNTIDLSDKENALKTANLTNYVGMQVV
jgi:hypothetical protein